MNQVELHIACHNLVNMDTFSKSDPLVVVEMKEGEDWVERGRTEMIKVCFGDVVEVPEGAKEEEVEKDEELVYLIA